jgi:uncharacterized protein (DUF1015 family)
MADIAPFHGILYEPGRAGALDDLIAPPYDVISPEERERLAAKSARAFVHVDLPRGDYEGSARTLRSWLAQGALIRDAQPTLYAVHQVFEHEGRERVRKGFVCALRLRKYDERVVLPHERTLSGPKADRLALARACGAHLSQVFGLYSDPAGAVEAELAALTARPAQLEGRTPEGTLHRLWRLTDPGAHARIAAVLAHRQVIIADGHHRYETMLALRDELRGSTPPGALMQSALPASLEYGSFFLARLEDPGLAVLPTHRAVFGLRGFDLDALLREADAWFACTELPAALDAAALRARLLAAGSRGPAFVLAAGERRALLSLRDGVEASGAAPLRRLDVSVLHELLLEKLLGIGRGAQERQEHLRYLKDPVRALEEARTGAAQAVFLLNPPDVRAMVRVAQAGEVMPQKSTFFFPKLASGLVLARFAPDEAL